MIASLARVTQATEEQAMVDVQTVIIVGLVGYILGLLTALRTAARAR